MFLIRKNHPILKFVRSSLVDLPTPANLSLNWNYGSLLGITLGIQIITGIILATRYSADGDIAFDSIIFLVDTVNNG
jgi:quinol-cytochrome oxidoreductase complex cytochrome b subunit